MDWRKMTIAAIRQRWEKEIPPQEVLRELMQDERSGVRKLAQTLLRRREQQLAERMRVQRMLAYEEEAYAKGYRCIAGIDEAGRGPLAGPVVAAAVILPREMLLSGIDDSKKLSQQKREELYEQICNAALSYGIGVVDAAYIDRYNILQATYEAMRQALHHLTLRPDLLLIDALTLPHVDMEQWPIIKGDAASQSIAAASILAKVTRDHMMRAYAQQYPEYGFERHMGYGTAEHLAALKKYGPTPLHRQTFAPVRAVCAQKV